MRLVAWSHLLLYSPPRRFLSSKVVLESSEQKLSRKDKRRIEEQKHLRKIDRLIEGKTSTWEITVGLEVHAQIVANTKLFSTGRNNTEAFPNTEVNSMDAALPGALPVFFGCVINLKKGFVGVMCKTGSTNRSCFGRDFK